MALTLASSEPSPAAGVGVLFNPRSHRNAKVRDAIAALPGVHIATPSSRADLRPTLEDFLAKGVECIAISGGDGTVRDVLTAGLSLFGDDWPALAVIPAGKTNALNVDLGAPKDWDVAGVIGALRRGNRVTRRPLIVRDLEGGGELAGFVFGAGVFTTAIAAGQDAHRLGAFDSLAVGATAVWGIVQGLLGSDRNRWRRGVPMTIRTGPGRDELPRTRWGEPDRCEAGRRRARTPPPHDDGHADPAHAGDERVCRPGRVRHRRIAAGTHADRYACRIGRPARRGSAAR